jgi:hypothetical protein
MAAAWLLCTQSCDNIVRTSTSVSVVCYTHRFEVVTPLTQCWIRMYTHLLVQKHRWCYQADG